MEVGEGIVLNGDKIINNGFSLVEIQCNLLDLPNRFYLAHDIPRDCNINDEIEEKFQLSEHLLIHPGIKHSRCILVGIVFNLVTKENHFDKATYKEVVHSLVALKEQIILEGVTHLAMSKLGKSDLLKWDIVKNMIIENLGDLKLELIVCDL